MAGVTACTGARGVRSASAAPAARHEHRGGEICAECDAGGAAACARLLAAGAAADVDTDVE